MTISHNKSSADHDRGPASHKRRLSADDDLFLLSPVKRINMQQEWPCDVPVATLSNMGNTCFLNSVLYMLRFAPSFLHNLHHLIKDLHQVNAKLSQNKVKTSSLGRNMGAIIGPSSRSTSSKDLLTLSNDLNKPKVQVVTEKLHEVFQSMHMLEMKESRDSHHPLGFLQAVRDANAIFEGNHQQDAHELLVYMLDNIRETCGILSQQVKQNPALLLADVAATVGNSGMGKLFGVRFSGRKTKKLRNNSSSEDDIEMNGVTVNDECCMENTPKTSYSFIRDDFEGVTVRRTKCLTCECITERKETFYDIPVAIATTESQPPDGAVDANDIYRRACVTTEKLCDSNKYLCEECMRYTEALRSVRFEIVPNLMILQLKRFTASSGGTQKVNTFMPTPLELQCFCETCSEAQIPAHHYKLCCVVMHVGATMASGHYISYVKASDFPDFPRELPVQNSGVAAATEKVQAQAFFKLFKTKNNDLKYNGKGGSSGNNRCKSVDCCAVKLSSNVVENIQNASGCADELWLECDDEHVRPITRQELEEKLSYNSSSSTSTPYLLLYSKTML